MNALLLAAGVAVLGTTLADFLLTTIGAGRRPLLSMRVCRGVFRVLRWSARHGQSWPHMVSGPLTMACLAVCWIAAVLLGWTLVFAAFEGGVGSTGDRPPPGWWDLLGHVGHLLSTLGAGITEAEGAGFYVLGVLVAVNGMLMLTLAVSFLLATTQTVVLGRAFASLAASADPASPDTFQLVAPVLAQCCASLRSVPFGLFYSTPDRSRAFPASLLALVEGAAADPALLRRYRAILRDLPDFEPDDHAPDAAFLTRLRDWTQRNQLHPPRRGDCDGPASRV